MENGKILDSAVTASSIHDAGLTPGNARLNLDLGDCAWTTTSAGRNNAWIQVDLGDIKSVTGVATQGRCRKWNQWVKSYTVSYSTDGQIWEFFKESDSPKVRLLTSFFSPTLRFTRSNNFISSIGFQWKHGSNNHCQS